VARKVEAKSTSKLFGSKAYHHAIHATEKHHFADNDFLLRFFSKPMETTDNDEFVSGNAEIRF
jgi:hypothetical protein